jgi:hypothetical protein
VKLPFDKSTGHRTGERINRPHKINSSLRHVVYDITLGGVTPIVKDALALSLSVSKPYFIY